MGAGLSVPPERRRGFQIQGKARALYNFTAQNPRLVVVGYICNFEIHTLNSLLTVYFR